MTQPTNNNNETLGAFAGLVILIVFLSILFMLTTPTVVNTGATRAEAETAMDEATEEVAEEMTEEPVAIVEEATEEAVVTEEMTEEPVTIVEEATEEAAVAEEMTEEPVAIVEEATEEVVDTSGEGAEVAYEPELVARGEQQFVVCAACHGPDGRGIPGLGKDLVGGEFATTATDEELFNVIVNGRPIWDAANTTMVDMPPRGGNPALTDDDVHAIIAYIRSLQSQ